MNPTENSLVFQKHYRDYDDFVQTVRAWNLDFDQLEKKPFTAYLFQCAAGPVQLSHAQFNTATTQRGDPPNGVRTLAILAEAPTTRFQWRRQEIPLDAVMLFPPGDELDVVTYPGGAGVFTLSFPEAFLQEIAACLHLDLGSLIQRGELTQADPFAMQKLRQFLIEIHDDLSVHPALLTSAEFQNRLTYELPVRLLRILGQAQDIRITSAPPLRRSAMSRIENYLVANPRQAHTVLDLCRVAGISERTLRNAFQDRFGLSPKTYLLSLRINGAHKELQRSDPVHRSVTEIANEWGFHHLSQFATDYRRFFGERPSETLKRK